ncbi:hypothetical protein [Mesorhizobium jarvisii]|uniref:hypothetical protein n=1 Tax=Mesorhizobium jarvisii TaxID=1777867 RepID=UPI0011DD4BE9|nr:hypothetical protein [Mesorhizobium jarvisii]MCH4561016.1 hypothetical protein [Mesorhizobium jarvisii]QGU20768.1 hypothetical protein MCHK_09650 [Mesorhizobium huakuii 7653R]
MRNKGDVVLAIALAVTATSVVPAQTQDPQTAVAGYSVIEGPFALDDGSLGVLGYVLKRTPGKADFQPCLGGTVLSVDDTRLKDTKLKCADEPTTDPHPVKVACSTVESQVAAVAAAVAAVSGDPKNAPVGTVYTKAMDSVTTTPPTPNEGWGQWEAALAAPVAVCGDKYVYLPKVQANQAWIGIVKNTAQ